MRSSALFALLVLSPAVAATGDEWKAQWALDKTPLNRSAQQLTEDTNAHLAAARRLMAQIIAVEGPRTIDNTLEVYNRLLMHLDATSNENGLLAQVHPDKTVVNAAQANRQEVSKMFTELSLSRELYDALAAVDVSAADAATAFFLEKELDDFRRAGVDKSEEVRARITELNETLTKLGQDWSQNIAEDTKEVKLDPEDLAGLPEDWIAGHPVGDDGKVTVNTSYPDYVPFIRYAEDGDAREAMYKAYQTRAYPVNMEVLREVLEARYEYATLLGFEDYADYVTSDKMIGSAQNAQDFIDRISAATARPVASEQRDLLRRKKKDQPWATEITDYEKAYYGNLVRKERFDFDSKAVRPYFDFNSVQAGLFELTSELFGVEYRRVEGLDLWHEDVSAWDLYEGDVQIGRFYLDLHPRPDKYNHAACFGYRDGIAGARLPQATLVCNFPNPREGEDGHALMEHGDVTTFFHEFGHLLHNLFAGHRRWAGNTGISTEWDFVEAPSQLLEEWCFDPGALAVFAKHYETGEVIPPELVGKLREAADFGKASNVAHQMFYAALSLNYYDRAPGDVDMEALKKELQERYTPYPYVEGTHMQCSFGHLYGYSAIYYTYMWSQVIAKDMFSRFEAEGVLNPDVALEYRRQVLDPGGSLPAAELVEQFLGRPYSFDAFERWLGEGPDVGE